MPIETNDIEDQDQEFDPRKLWQMTKEEAEQGIKREKDKKKKAGKNYNPGH